MPANVIEMLVEDHRTVKAMFERFESGGEAERDKVVHDIIHSLNTHSRVEETILYPFIRSEVLDGDSMINEAEAEHQEAKDAIAKLSALEPSDPEFDEAFRALREGMEHHMEEEEGEVFPKLAQAADEQALAELGQKVAQAKAMSTRPSYDSDDSAG